MAHRCYCVVQIAGAFPGDEQFVPVSSNEGCSPGRGFFAACFRAAAGRREGAAAVVRCGVRRSFGCRGRGRRSASAGAGRTRCFA